MSAVSDFTTVLVKDSRIAGITDQLSYSVQSGASSNTYQVFTAVSKSNNQLAFNIQVPSENVIVNREILLRAVIDFTMEVKVNGATCQAVNFCGADALSPFPLNQLFTTASAQINNTNVSSNIADLLPVILQLADQRELSTYNDMCPALLDTFYAKFADTFISSVGNGGAHGASTTTAVVNAFPQTATSSLYMMPAANSPLAGFNNQSLDGAFRPRGAFPLKVVSIKRDTVANSAFSAANGETIWVALQAEVIEPIIGLSPFTYGNNQFNKAGLVGINSMNFVFNVDSTLSRLMCSAVPSSNVTARTNFKKLSPGHRSETGVGTATSDLFSTAQLLINFLSSQPTDLIPARNVVPYVDLPRFITQPANAIPTATQKILSSDGVIGLVSGASTSFVSQGIQLNQLPDYFIIAARCKNGTKLYNNNSGEAQDYAPHFLPITRVSVNLNNTSGLLSSATQADLYRISRNNHSKQTWDAFRGRARVYQCATSTGTAADLATAALTSTGHLGFKDIATTGSVLVLNPAYDLSIPDYLSSGSLGAYNFQFDITCENYNEYEVKPEIIVICANSGVFSSIAGSSNIYTGILTKSMVLDAKKEAAESPIMSSQFERMVGGAMMPSNAMSGDMPLVKEFMSKLGKSREKMGSGVSSGGGVYSGGSRFSHLTR
jgi:hypothetical protein